MAALKEIPPLPAAPRAALAQKWKCSEKDITVSGTGQDLIIALVAMLQEHLHFNGLSLK